MVAAGCLTSDGLADLFHDARVCAARDDPGARRCCRLDDTLCRAKRGERGERGEPGARRKGGVGVRVGAGRTSRIILSRRGGSSKLVAPPVTEMTKRGSFKFQCSVSSCDTWEVWRWRGRGGSGVALRVGTAHERAIAISFRAGDCDISRAGECEGPRERGSAIDLESE